jgi:hypothetical protein
MTRLDAAIVERARAVPIEWEIERRNIKLRRQGRERTGPCPVCGGTDRFSANTHKQVWRCRRCDAAGDVIDLCIFLDGCDFRTAVETLLGEQPRHESRPAVNAAPAQQRNDEPPAQWWQPIWNESKPPAGTAVETYLARRKLALPPSEAIRFHPACPFGKNADGRTIRTPAMVALVRGIISNEPQAIHRTAISAAGEPVEIEGRKRMTLGPIAGGAVKLTADEDVTIGLGIGEGIESTLSLLHLPEGEWVGSPVWSLLNEGGLRAFPLLAGIETLVIAVDNDPPGVRAAREVTQRWMAANREVLLFEATEAGADLNNVVQEE